MTDDLKPKTAEVNGRFWGASAEDWANIQEGTAKRAYVATLDKTGVSQGTAYLDVGCGSGMAIEMACARGAEVSGIDASTELLAIAQTRVPAAQLHQGDVEELPFPDGSFDVVTGFNSFQYAGNPTIALKEAKRVAKPDASIVIMTWGDPEGMEAAALVTALGPLLPPPPPGAAGPFALSDEAVLRKFASDAGLTPVEIFDVDCPFEYPDEATAVRGLNSSGVSARAMEHSGGDAVTRANAEALAPFRRTDGSYCAMARFRCLVAKP